MMKHTQIFIYLEASFRYLTTLHAATFHLCVHNPANTTHTHYHDVPQQKESAGHELAPALKFMNQLCPCYSPCSPSHSRQPSITPHPQQQHMSNSVAAWRERVNNEARLGGPDASLRRPLWNISTPYALIRLFT